MDDIVNMSFSQKLINEFKSDIMNTSEMIGLKLLNYFLGLEVKQEEYGAFVTQRKYVEDLLKEFNMQQCKASATSIAISDKLQFELNAKKTDAKKYRSLIGRLIYLTHIRPDISFSVGMLSKFMNCPTKYHLGAAKRIWRYLAGTTGFGLWYT